MDLSRMKRHVGMLNNTGVRCVVVYRTVPGDEEHCLVVETERLPDMYHDNVMECVNSAEAQKTSDFYEVLNRRTFADGLNGLQALHYKGFLRKVPVTQVSLLPFPGQELPLALLNAQLSGNMDSYNADAKVKDEAVAKQKREDNPLSDLNDPVQVAQTLLIQAELLDAEAESKRNEAYELAPDLKPKAKKAKAKTKATETVTESTETQTRGRPKLSEEEKAIRAEERKVKRRERDRANAAKKKAEKAAAEKKAAVDEKIMRDANRADS